MQPLKIDNNQFLYKTMIGVGGIGSGMFFRLNGDHTLGREESRSGFFLDRRDYCKLHIISHYVQILLGQDFKVIPVGKVGNDDVGEKLLLEMAETGMIMNYVEKSAGDQTLFSFCFIYPDGSGGNMTTSNSACSKVDESLVMKAESEFIKYKGKGIVLAAPEVPLITRASLLKLGSKYNFLRAASFTSEEMCSVRQSEIFGQLDLLAINLDETAAAVRMPIDKNPAVAIIETAVTVFTNINPQIKLSITKGKDGSWTWDGSALTHLPAFSVQVENTAGAGDAHLAGLLVGLTAGLSLPEAQQLAALTSGSSVESPHTINKETNRAALKKIADRSKSKISKNVYKLLEDKV